MALPELKQSATEARLSTLDLPERGCLNAARRAALFSIPPGLDMTLQDDRPESYLLLQTEVAEALAAGGPVVALESTAIAHGLPRPRNLETARRMEALVRAEGAVPATVAVLDGRIRIGLGAEELGTLAASEDVIKASRRDLAPLVASGRQSARLATTVASTGTSTSTLTPRSHLVTLS